MLKINPNLTLYTKIQIIFSAAKKALRGFFRGLFLKKRRGLFFVGKSVKILNSQYIEIGRNVKFEDQCEVQGLSSNGVYMGNNVTIGRNVMIRPSSYYGVGHIGYGLKIGNNSSIGPNGFIGAAGKVVIGDDVMVGPGVMIIAENHNFSKLNQSIKSQGVQQKGIVIKDNVWIGANVTILDGVIIPSGTVIGANTIITKTIDYENSIIYDKRNKVLNNR